MKTTILLLTLTTSLLVAEDVPLPPISENLVSKLEDWEAQKKRDLHRELSEKRKEVAKLLSQHLEAATRSGELDEAIEIRKVIQKLSADFEVTLSAAAPEEKVTTSKPTDTKDLIGSTWVREDNLEVIFGEDRVTVPTPEKPAGVRLPVTYDKEQVYLTWDNGHKAFFEFDEEWESFNFLGHKFEPKE